MSGRSLEAMREYYHRRAREYDETVTAGLEPRDAADLELEAGLLGEALAALPPVLTLDVACGTGLFTRHLPGRIVALDRSRAMLGLAGSRLPGVHLVQAAVPDLPFGAGAFDRMVTAHFYGHLVEDDRLEFLAEAARVARELVVVDSAAGPGARPDGWQERRLRDGTRYRIYKRHFTPARLRGELGGGEILFAGRHFVAVRTGLGGTPAGARLGGRAASPEHDRRADRGELRRPRRAERGHGATRLRVPLAPECDERGTRDCSRSV